MSLYLTVPITEWLERHAEKQRIAGSITVEGTCFHFKRACTLVQKSYCYTPGVGVSVRVGVGVGVRVGVHKMLGQMLKSWNFSLYVFFLAF